MSQPLDAVRDHLRGHFARVGIDAEPDAASVTFLGVERIEVLRFGPDRDGIAHYVSLGCSRHPMTDPAAGAADPVRGPRAEVVMSLRVTTPTPGLARSLAVVAATPAVEGVVLVPDALIDLSGPLWDRRPFTAVLLGESSIADLPPEPLRPGGVPVGGADHRDGGGVGAAQGRRGDAAGLERRRRRRRWTRGAAPRHRASYSQWLRRKLRYRNPQIVAINSSTAG